MERLARVVYVVAVRCGRASADGFCPAGGETELGKKNKGLESVFSGRAIGEGGVASSFWG